MSHVDYLYEEPAASELELSRYNNRQFHRLTYDCFNAEVEEGQRVRCGKGRILRCQASKDGTITMR